MKKNRFYTVAALITALLLFVNIIAKAPNMHSSSAGESLTFSDGKVTLYNVKSAFGAKGDGVTDDTSAIQNAINSVGNGVVFFPYGTYIVSGLKLRPNTELISQNWQTPPDQWEQEAVLKAAAGAKVVLNAQGVSGASIEGIKIDGNNAKSGGISGGLYNGTISYDSFVNCGTGIGYKLAGSYYDNIFTEYIANCRFTGCTVAIANAIDCKILGNTVTNCGIGISTGGDTSVCKNTIIGCTAYGLTVGYHCVVADNAFQINGLEGLYLSKNSQYVTVSGNTFSCNGQSAQNAKDNTDILAEQTEHITLIDNTSISTGQGIKLPDYSLYCTGCSNVKLYSNDFLGSKNPQYTQ